MFEDYYTFTLVHKTQGQQLITIDAHNMSLLDGYNWILYGGAKGRIRAEASISTPGALVVKCAKTKVLLARLILKVSNLINVHYIDNNPLNLTEANLAPAPFAQYTLQGTKRSKWLKSNIST